MFDRCWLNHMFMVLRLSMNWIIEAIWTCSQNVQIYLIGQLLVAVATLRASNVIRKTYLFVFFFTRVFHRLDMTWNLASVSYPLQCVSLSKYNTKMNCSKHRVIIFKYYLCGKHQLKLLHFTLNRKIAAWTIWDKID